MATIFSSLVQTWCTFRRRLTLRRYRSTTVRPSNPCERTVSDAQEQVLHWDQRRLAAARILLQGAGGIGSQVGCSLVKMGVGELLITDPDVIEPSNLNRQFYLPKDLYREKGPTLAKRLAAIGCMGTTTIGYPLYFTDVLDAHPEAAVDLVVSGVDNNRARREAATWCHRVKVPLVCVGIAREGTSAYVFVQEAGRACLGCHLGDQLKDTSSSPCPGTPAVIDSIQTIAGFAVYAVTSLLMGRPRSWNLTTVWMETGMATPALVQPRAACGLCHGQAS